MNGEPRRLLSIAERNDGRLIITGAMETHALNEENIPTYPILQEKITIHHSGSSADGGNQIHHTCTFKDRPRIDTYLYTLAIKQGLVAPLYVHVVRDITTAERQLEIGARDRLIQLCEYDPKKHILIMCILIGPPNAGNDRIEWSSKFNIEAVPFTNFTIFVASSFGVGTSKDSWYGRLATAPQKIDGVASEDGPLVPADGLAPRGARLWLESQLLVAHLQAHRQNLDLLEHAPGEMIEVASAAALAGIFKAPYDINDKPLRKLRRQLAAIFDRYDRLRKFKP